MSLSPVAMRCLVRKKNRPLVGFTMPQTMLINVVFPALFGPSSAKISHGAISRHAHFSACSTPPLGLGQVLVRSWITSIAVMAGKHSRRGESHAGHSPLERGRDSFDRTQSADAAAFRDAPIAKPQARRCPRSHTDRVQRQTIVNPYASPFQGVILAKCS